MRSVLTIAGFDPSSGAGVTADLMVFAAHGLFGTSAITNLTVQSTVGVDSSHAVEPELVAMTLAFLDADLPPAGIKIGALGTAWVVEAVALYLEAVREAGGRVPVVLDPVIRSSAGRELLEARAVPLLRERLLPLVDWVTPNLEELALLTGRPVSTRGEMSAAAELLQMDIADRGGRVHVLAKGGHLEAPDDFLLTSAGEGHWLAGIRVETRATHGTGCALSSAVLSRVVLGDAPAVAAATAKRYVVEAMRRASPMGRGHGPMELLWPLRTHGG
jgi:hydroxymethylpyrimidine/phosphomethylpyrimidine kinase